MRNIEVKDSFSNEDGELYFKALGNLITYANEKLSVTGRDAISMVSAEKDELDAGARVCRRLWQSPEIVDAYADENPYHVPEDELDVVRPWRYAVRDLFTVVGARPGRIIVINDSSLFEVESVVGRIDAYFAEIPQLCALTLLPFKGKIVTDSIFIHLSLSITESGMLTLKNWYESLLASGAFVTDGSDLCSYAMSAKPSNRLDDVVELDIESALGPCLDIPVSVPGKARLPLD